MRAPVTHTETDRYRIETQGNGLFAILTRKADGASAFMQGDDAGEFLTAVENEPDVIGWLDWYCSQYDDVMSFSA